MATLPPTASPMAASTVARSKRTRRVCRSPLCQGWPRVRRLPKTGLGAGTRRVTASPVGSRRSTEGLSAPNEGPRSPGRGRDDGNRVIGDTPLRRRLYRSGAPPCSPDPRSVNERGTSAPRPTRCTTASANKRAGVARRRAYRRHGGGGFGWRSSESWASSNVASEQISRGDHAGAQFASPVPSAGVGRARAMSRRYGLGSGGDGHNTEPAVVVRWSIDDFTHLTPLSVSPGD